MRLKVGNARPSRQQTAVEGDNEELAVQVLETIGGQAIVHPTDRVDTAGIAPCETVSSSGEDIIQGNAHEGQTPPSSTILLPSSAYYLWYQIVLTSPHRVDLPVRHSSMVLRGSATTELRCNAPRRAQPLPHGVVSNHHILPPLPLPAYLSWIDRASHKPWRSAVSPAFECTAIDPLPCFPVLLITKGSDPMQYGESREVLEGMREAPSWDRGQHDLGIRHQGDTEAATEGSLQYSVSISCFTAHNRFTEKAKYLELAQRSQ